MKLPKFNTKPANSKIEDQEKLTWLQKRALKKVLRIAQKKAPDFRKEYEKGIKSREEIIDKLMELTSVLQIEDEIKKTNEETGKTTIEYVPITRERLANKTETEILDDLEQVMKEATKLI